MPHVLEYVRKPPAKQRPPVVVRIAQSAAVLVPLVQLFCFAGDLAMREALWKAYDEDWVRTELIRRGHERDRRALGYAVVRAPEPPQPPIVRRAALFALAGMRLPLLLLVLAFGIGMSRRGWPARPPPWLMSTAILITTFTAVALVAIVAGYGWEFTREHLTAGGLMFAGTASSLALVAPVFARRE